MCIYGIELLDDNIAEGRDNLLEIFADYLGVDETDDLRRAAANVFGVPRGFRTADHTMIC